MEQFDGFTKELVREWESMTEDKQQGTCSLVADASCSSSLVSSHGATEPAIIQQQQQVVGPNEKLDKFIVQKQIQLSKKIMSDPTISDRIKKICSEMIHDFFVEAHAEEVQFGEEAPRRISEEKKSAFLPPSSSNSRLCGAKLEEKQANNDVEEEEFELFDFDDDDEKIAPTFKKQQQQSGYISPCKVGALSQMPRPRVVFEDDELPNVRSVPPAQAAPSLPSAAPPNNQQPPSSTGNKPSFFSSLLDTFQSVYGYISNVFGGIWSRVFGGSKQQQGDQQQQQQQQQEQLGEEEGQEVSDEEEKLMNGIIGGALFLITGFLFYISVKRFAPDLSKAFAGAISTFFVGTTARRTRTFASKRF